MDITVQELRQKLESAEKFMLIDVREPWEHEEFNLGGELIPVGDIMNKMWELEDHKADEIVLYCRTGSRSGMVQGLLLGNGFTNVINLKGGVTAWMEAFGREKV